MNQGLTLPEPIYPRFPEKLSDPGPETAPEKRDWTLPSGLSLDEGMAFPLYPLSSAARRVPSRSLRIYSSNISATSIAGTAGPSTTKSKV